MITGVVAMVRLTLSLAPRLVLFAGLALPVAAAAQSGTINYNQSTRLDFDVPPNSPFFRDMPKARVKPMVLTYTAGATLFVAAPDTGRRGSARAGGMEIATLRRTTRVEGMAVSGRPMMAFRMNRGADDVSQSYTDLADDQATEVHEFLGRQFRITEPRPDLPWKLTGEQATFLGYNVMQATARQDSTEIEAWFTPDIPVSGGPGSYGGLPGMILTLAVDTNRIVYTATAVDTTTPIAELVAPTDGDEVTRAEYDKTVKEKMAEMNQGRRGRRN